MYLVIILRGIVISWVNRKYKKFQRNLTNAYFFQKTIVSINQLELCECIFIPPQKENLQVNPTALCQDSYTRMYIRLPTRRAEFACSNRCIEIIFETNLKHGQLPGNR